MRDHFILYTDYFIFYTDFIFYRTMALYARILWIMIGECSVISLQQNCLKLTISACTSWFWSVISTAVYHWIDHVIKSIGVFATFSVSWNMSFLTLVGRVVEGTSVWNRRCKIGDNTSITFTNGDSFFSFSGWKLLFRFIRYIRTVCAVTRCLQLSGEPC